MANLTKLDKVFAGRLSALVAAAEAATGQKAQFTSGYRTGPEQAQIKANSLGRSVTWQGKTYKPQGTERGFKAAWPGHSRHEIEQAQAVDFGGGPVRTWARAHARQFGLETISGDEPHIQLARGIKATKYDSMPNALADRSGVRSLIPPRNIPDTGAPKAGGSVEAYIRQAATARGIDPDVAVRVAKSEGGLDDPLSDVGKKEGRRETSYGPFQLRINGGLGDEALRAGVDPRKDWQGGVDFALNYAAKNGWGSWYGAVNPGPKSGFTPISRTAGLGGAQPVAIGTPPATAYTGGPPQTTAQRAAAEMAAGPLRKGATDARTGGAVTRLQQQLVDRGFDLGPHGVDGRFGKDTAAAVRAAEKSYGLDADRGVAGPQVQAALAYPREIALPRERPAGGILSGRIGMEGSPELAGQVPRPGKGDLAARPYDSGSLYPGRTQAEVITAPPDPNAPPLVPPPQAVVTPHSLQTGVARGAPRPAPPVAPGGPLQLSMPEGEAPLGWAALDPSGGWTVPPRVQQDITAPMQDITPPDAGGQFIGGNGAPSVAPRNPGGYPTAWGVQAPPAGPPGGQFIGGNGVPGFSLGGMPGDVIRRTLEGGTEGALGQISPSGGPPALQQPRRPITPTPPPLQPLIAGNRPDQFVGSPAMGYSSADPALLRAGRGGTGGLFSQAEIDLARKGSVYPPLNGPANTMEAGNWLVRNFGSGAAASGPPDTSGWKQNVPGGLNSLSDLPGVNWLFGGGPPSATAAPRASALPMPPRDIFRPAVPAPTGYGEGNQGPELESNWTGGPQQSSLGDSGSTDVLRGSGGAGSAADVVPSGGPYMPGGAGVPFQAGGAAVVPAGDEAYTSEPRVPVQPGGALGGVPYAIDPMRRTAGFTNIGNGVIQTPVPKPSLGTRIAGGAAGLGASALGGPGLGMLASAIFNSASRGSFDNAQPYRGMTGGNYATAVSPWGNYSTGSSPSASPFTPAGAGWHAPSFNPVSGGALYAYNPDTHQYTDSQGRVHSYD